MASPPLATPLRWYRSFYWRIAISFAVFVVVLIIVQSLIFSYLIARAPFTGRSPNNLAAVVAADLGSFLSEGSTTRDIEAYLRQEYAGAQPIYVVMKNGRIAANRSVPLDLHMQRTVEAVLGGTNFRRAGTEPMLGGPPTVMTPIQVDGELRGMVVLPPAAPSPVREFSRLFSVPGTLLLVVATALAAVVIFGPARRRLRALEEATARLGAGDLSARAPEEGGDEIAHVAAAFNRMAGELASRDEALRTADGQRRQMLADVSHELKTPLTAMRGYVETLHMADARLDEETRERYFSTLERETFRLDRIVKDLVDLARLEHGAGTLDVRLFAIDRVFAHISGRHEHEATSRGIAIRSHVTDAADQVTGDPDRLEQALDNLVVNALRYTPRGGTIDLKATGNGDWIVLSVTDSGAGIPPEHAAHVFERFYKVDAARANGSSGSGLGLSIAKAIVEQHGGTIRLTSTPGRTVFAIALPQHQQERVH